jgi:hypothetical protein
VLFGFAALAQPSFLLVAPVLVAAFELLRGSRPSVILRRAAVVALATIAVVAPWTMRNYRVLGAFVPVSSNGGRVLWVGNNPDATGLSMPMPDWLGDLDELSADRAARAAALDWMRRHPGQAAALSVRKQMLFWADDAKGAYETLRRSVDVTRTYVVLKILSNVFWLALLWSSLTCAAAVARRSGGIPNVLAMVLVAVVYEMTLHSIFESDGRFHTPLMGLIAVLAACLAGKLRETAAREPAASAATPFASAARRSIAAL